MPRCCAKKSPACGKKSAPRTRTDTTSASNRTWQARYGSLGATETVGFSQGLIPDPGSLGEAVLCAGTPGTVMVHHSLTVHSAGANTSGRPRRSIAYVFFSASAEIDEEARSRYMAALQAQRESKGIAHNPAAVVV